MLVDSHIHLDSKQYASDLPEVIGRALSGGVKRMITPGTDLDSSRKCIEIAEKYPEVYAAVGVHPHEADEAPSDYPDEITNLSVHRRVVAIGETGLDFFRDYSSHEAQIRVFRGQLTIAKEHSLPVIIHSRDSDDALLSSITEVDYTNGVVHCFTGSEGFAQSLIKLGFYLGFTGIVTFEKGSIAEVVKKIPLDRLLIETDGPYMTPAPYRGKRNEPVYVRYMAEKVAELRGITVEEVEEATTSNCRRLFTGIE